MEASTTVEYIGEDGGSGENGIDAGSIIDNRGKNGRKNRIIGEDNKTSGGRRRRE